MEKTLGWGQKDGLKHLFMRKELEIVDFKIVTTKFPLQWFISRLGFYKTNISGVLIYFLRINFLNYLQNTLQF